jgi:cyclase
MKFESLGPSSWACIGGGDDVFHSYGANQGFVAHGDSCLVVDSGFHNRTAQQILRRVEKLRPRRLMLIDTHYHSDHVLGNSVFAYKGTVVLSHEKCRRSMRRHSERLLAKYRARNPELARLLEGVEVSYPSLTYRDSVRLFAEDDYQVDVFHPGVRAHTDGDSIVHVPDDRVVFAGDVLWVGYHPNLEDSSIQGQVRALKMILRLNPRRIVPGHGPVCGIAEARRFIRYLEELDRNSKRAVRDGASPKEIVNRAIPSWSQDWKMKRLVAAYLEKLAGRGK